jgi:putative ABC transport system permease protein
MLEHLHYNENNEAWTGGDSYPTFIKLHKGADIAEVEAAMPAFFKKHGLENMNETWQKKYFFINIADTMYATGNILQMQIIYGVIAFIALLVACLNYVLLTISSLAERSKTIATMKCNGAVRGKIFSMLLGETLLIITASILLVIFIIACMHQVIPGYFGYTVSELFALERIWIPAFVCIAGFAIAGIIPAFLFSAISTSYAFKHGGVNRQWWKKSLLFLQITAIVATVIFLMVINRQSAHIINADYGYKFDRIVTTSMSVKISKAEALANKALAELQNKNYTSEFKYVEKFNNEDYVYTLKNGAMLQQEMNTVYAEFSNWLGSWEM